jgi:3-oxoacyl-[acyl-carrier protein] reductase
MRGAKIGPMTEIASSTRAATSLAGRVALVTGAGRGIGAACAQALAAAGATVAVSYRSSEAEAQAVVDAITAAGGDGFPLQFDAADSAAVDAAVKQIVDNYGRLDILVNNAGQRFDGLAQSMSDEQWRAALAANLDSAFYCCRAAIRAMKRTGGSIVNVSSVAAFAGSAGQANYSAAKGGVVSLTRSLALEYGGRGIRVNCVVPGIIETAMTADVPEKSREDWLGRIPLRRFGTPDDVARAVLFLASDMGAYVTGATLHVNGGGYPA